MQAEERGDARADQQVVCGLPVEASVLFSDKKGTYNHRIEKARTKLLKKLGFLGRFLAADERILLVTTGCSPFTTVEQLTIGAAWTIVLKRAFFVFTNKRLLHIPTTTGWKYRGSIAQILYEDCRSLTVKGSRLVAEYRTGKKEKFNYISSRDRAIINHFAIEPNEADEPSEYPQRNHLCAHCTAVLPTPAPACPSCGLPFKTKAKARVYSMLFPGGGYFYVNRPLMGVLDAVVESNLLALTVIGIVEGLRGNPEVGPMGIVFGGMLAFEKLLTVYHSNSFLAEFIPKDVKSLLRGQPQSAPAPQLKPPQELRGMPEPEDVLSVR